MLFLHVSNDEQFSGILKSVPSRIAEPHESDIRRDILQMYLALTEVDIPGDKNSPEGQPPKKRPRQRASVQPQVTGKLIADVFALLNEGLYSDGLPVLEEICE
jgi:hypothetical protein